MLPSCLFCPCFSSSQHQPTPAAPQQPTAFHLSIGPTGSKFIYPHFVFSGWQTPKVLTTTCHWRTFEGTAGGLNLLDAKNLGEKCSVVESIHLICRKSPFWSLPSPISPHLERCCCPRPGQAAGCFELTVLTLMGKLNRMQLPVFLCRAGNRCCSPRWATNIWGPKMWSEGTSG